MTREESMICETVGTLQFQPPPVEKVPALSFKYDLEH